MYSVISIDNISREEWGRFVYEHPNGNVFQTPEMYEVYKNTKNYEPVFIGVTDNSGEIVGTLLSVIQREFGGPLGILSSRCVTWGGPLIKDSLLPNEKNEVLSLILKKLNDIVKRKALYMEFRNLWNTNDSRRIFENNGYEWEDHLDILIDLTKSEEALWQQMKRNRKRNIKKAKNYGVSFREATSRSEVYEIINLIKNTYSRANLFLSDKSLFLSAWNILKPKELVNFFYLSFNNNMVSARTELLYKNMVYDWYAGTSDDGYKYHFNDYIVWAIWLWAKDNGYSIFDFGGAGNPNKPYGPRDFKLRFGGQMVNFGRYKGIYRKITFKLLMKGLDIYKKVR